MSGECEGCGEHAIECRCHNETGAWKKAKDSVPLEFRRVLTYSTDHEYRLDYVFEVYGTPFWSCRLDDEYRNVTHWMELPSPPKD